jgi:hypothetical protein
VDNAQERQDLATLIEAVWGYFTEYGSADQLAASERAANRLGWTLNNPSTNFTDGPTRLLPDEEG